MVLLAKWILENNPNARVAIITDRDELDKQIERVFTQAGESIARTNSGQNLMRLLGHLRPPDEDQVGQLQSQEVHHPLQHRPGQEAAGVS
jgi:type I site-specific restriction-modification system R (restriction) subunit